jgi:hypothetical protein
MKCKFCEFLNIRELIALILNQVYFFKAHYKVIPMDLSSIYKIRLSEMSIVSRDIF